MNAVKAKQFALVGSILKNLFKGRRPILAPFMGNDRERNGAARFTFG
jgi:hypothetical protein